MLGTVAVAGILAITGCSRSSKSPSGLAANGDSGGSGTAAATSTDNGDFGSLKNICSKGKGTNIATGRGVTATSINLGVISDAGYVGKPGLNKELWDASDVFVKWCNSQGGINGRKLIGTHLDAALTQYKQQVLIACDTSFALVGGGGVLDDTGEPARVNCLLPSFPGFLLTPTARASQLKWQSTPAPLDAINAGGFRRLMTRFPDATDNIGFLTANLAATVVVGNQVQEAAKQVGLKAGSYNAQYNSLGEATWIPFANTMKQKGVKGLFFLGEPQDLAKLELAMKAIGYKPTWIATLPNIYDESFLAAAGGSAFNTFTPVNSYPFELADQKAAGSEAMQKYLALFAEYAPKGKARTGLGVDSFSSWLLFAQAAKPCGANLTPRCLYDNAQKITSFDGGGLIAPTNPADDAASPCTTTVEAVGNKFVVQDVKPTNGVYNCDASNIVHLTGNYGKGITLADEGKKVSDLKG